jgi:hypothetical protein
MGAVYNWAYFVGVDKRLRLFGNLDSDWDLSREGDTTIILSTSFTFTLLLGT